MASCDDDFSILGDDSSSHHHHHHQTFASHHTRFAAKPAPTLHHHNHHHHHHPSISPTKKPTVLAPSSSDAYPDPTTFCFDPAGGTGDPASASSDPSGNPFSTAIDGDPDGKAAGEGGGGKRKDRCGPGAGDDLSDDGGTPTSYGYKKSKLTAPSASGSGDYRKDREEWSDSAIACLLDAYMEKFVQLNRGNLRGRDWVEVAAMVSERADPQKACCDKQKVMKSVEQCKNKMDNLKKRYKVEVRRMNNGMPASNWTWFKKMEEIVGSTASAKAAISDEDKSASGSATLVPRQAKRYAPVTSSPVGIANNMKTKTLPSTRRRRVLFRISGTALAGTDPQNVDPKVIMLIAREVAYANRLGVEVAIVVGGSNLFCPQTWLGATSLDRATACQIGMMASIMNSILLQASLEKLGVPTRLQTTFTMHEIAEPYIKRRAIRHLEKERVVIFGGAGTGLGNPLISTDTIAALRASDINADVVLKGRNVDGVFDCHLRNGNDVAFEHISFRECASPGFNGIDMTAVSLCEESGIPVMIFNLLEPGNISKALCGDQVGTLIDHSGRMS